MPIISFNIASVDEFQKTNLITNIQFDNYINLKFKISDTMEKKYKTNTIHVPAKYSSKDVFDQSIVVYRIDMKIIGNLYVTVLDSTYDLRVCCLYKGKSIKQGILF